MKRRELPAATIATVSTLVLVFLIYVGSRRFKDFDSALIGYAVATVFAFAAIVYRYTLWITRPPTWRYFHAGWRNFLSWRNFRRYTFLVPPCLVARHHRPNLYPQTELSALGGACVDLLGRDVVVGDHFATDLRLDSFYADSAGALPVVGVRPSLVRLSRRIGHRLFIVPRAGLDGGVVNHRRGASVVAAVDGRRAARYAALQLRPGPAGALVRDLGNGVAAHGVVDVVGK